MKPKKLTLPQFSALKRLRDFGQSDYYELMIVGANGATTTKLVSLGLVELIDDRGMKAWKITDDGVYALSMHREPTIKKP
jgi:predicted transcriptional regulator with HTH domain